MDGLHEILKKLSDIHKNLVKDGPNRKRSKEITDEKFKTISQLCDKVDELEFQIDVKGSEEEKLLKVGIVKKIFELQEDSILRLEKGLKISEEKIEEIVETVQANNSLTISTMASFDLKSASALIPVMTGEEDVTRQIIDGIELYASLLSAEARKVLTAFVLKTRLNSTAKLKLKSSYESNTALIADIKKFLLPPKSATALAAKLAIQKQGNKSVQEFGNEIEVLLTNLTLAQTGENSGDNPAIHAINEKNAICVFANGLKSQEMRTIVKARDYSSLREAIQGALDEEKPPKEENVNLATKGHNSKGKNRGFRGNNRGRKNQGNWRNNDNSNHSNNSNSNSNRGHGSRRGRGSRNGNSRNGNNNSRNNNNSQNQSSQNVNVAQESSATSDEQAQINFFR